MLPLELPELSATLPLPFRFPFFVPVELPQRPVFWLPLLLPVLAPALALPLALPLTEPLLLLPLLLPVYEFP